MDKWGHGYLIELKTLWKKEKLLVMSNFSFSHYVFKSCQLLMRQNECLWSKGLNMFALLTSLFIYWYANTLLCGRKTQLVFFSALKFYSALKTHG